MKLCPVQTQISEDLEKNISQSNGDIFVVFFEPLSSDMTTKVLLKLFEIFESKMAAEKCI